MAILPYCQAYNNTSGEHVPVIRSSGTIPLMANTLYYGDNLDVMRQHLPDESVDLIYVDPPFNSNRDYNILFAEQSG